MVNEEEPIAMEMLHEIKTENKRKDHIIKILIAVIIVLIISLVASNIAWLVYENQFETIGEQEQIIEDITDTNNTDFTQEMK